MLESRVMQAMGREKMRTFDEHLWILWRLDAIRLTSTTLIFQTFSN